MLARRSALLTSAGRAAALGRAGGTLSPSALRAREAAVLRENDGFREVNEVLLWCGPLVTVLDVGFRV